MAIPIDKELYEKAKKIADKTYNKPSAFKSGYIQKLYKEMGGEYVDDGERKLKRWFDEEWMDVNPFKSDSTYAVFRPTVRVNKSTPLTVDEIDKKNLIEQSIIKQLIKGNANLRPFIKGSGIELIPANKIPKSNEIWDYSNPIEAQKKAFDYLGDTAMLYRSLKPDKKYMIFDPYNQKWIHFGTMKPAMEDYTKHKDYERMLRYRARATNMKGNWKSNPYSANNLSINILW